MSKVLCFAGRKKSGKNTLCNFMTGYQLRAHDMVKSFDLDEYGQLCVESEDGNGILDLNAYHTNPEFYDWLSVSVWPYAKIYAFADPLKEMCVGLFNVPRECVYGTDEQKNTVMEHLLWENMPGVITPEQIKDLEFDGKVLAEYNMKDLGLIYRPKGAMTARQFMQFLGTEIMRKIYGPIWVNYLTKAVDSERSSLSLISDLRFDNECEGLKSLEHDVKIVQLTAGKKGDSHDSEKGIDPKYVDLLLDNANMNLIETCEVLVGQLNKWGWLGGN